MRTMILVCPMIFFLTTDILYASNEKSGILVDQTVTTTVEDAEGSEARYTWKLDGAGRFRVDIASPKGKVSYIFTGRILYACTTLSPMQANRLGQSLPATSQSLIEKMRRGSCQEVPANFMMVYFLSPHGTVSGLDYSDGMEIDLNVTDYSFSQEPGAPGNGCIPIKRKYTVNRQSSAATTKHLASEISCLDPTVRWRTLLWKMMSRTLIRQPKMRGLLVTLAKDSRNMPGLVVRGQTKFSRVDIKGKVREGSIHVSTSDIQKNMAFPKKLFRLPTGYAIVDVRSLIPDEEDDSDGSSPNKGDSTNDPTTNPVPRLFFHFFGGFL